MKKLIAAFSAVSFAFMPYAPAFAAGELPVTKTLIATIPAPWAKIIPSDPARGVYTGDHFQVVSCGRRIYLIWWEQFGSPSANQASGNPPSGGPYRSHLYALKDDGTPISKKWVVVAEDSESSTVHFNNACVGDRAVMVNTWSDNASKTAGEMATSVDGTEPFGPSWKPDGRTIYHWYRVNDATPSLHKLYSGKIGTFISGSVIRNSTSTIGSSVNYVLGPDGKAYVMHAPWYKDLTKVSVPANSLLRADFSWYRQAWHVIESDRGGYIGAPLDNLYDGGAFPGPASIRSDADADWHAWAVTDARCEAERRVKTAFSVEADGLHFRPWNDCDADGRMTQIGTDSRIHYAPTTDLATAPRIYSLEIVNGRPGETFAYAVRTGDGKIQVWRAVVK